MSSEIVPFKRDNLTITLAPEFVRKRDDLLGTASMITAVNDPEGNEFATVILKEMGDLRRIVESSRKELKQPIIECGKRIDVVASEACEKLSVEERRIARLAGDYVAAIEARARAAAAAAETIARGQENELQERLAKARDLDEHQRIREEIATRAQMAPVIPPVPSRADGQTLREETEVEVQDLLAFASWALRSNLSHLLKIEVRKTEVVKLAGTGITMPGISVKKVNKVRVS